MCHRSLLECPGSDVYDDGLKKEMCRVGTRVTEIRFVSPQKVLDDAIKVCLNCKYWSTKRCNRTVLHMGTLNSVIRLV